VVQANLQGASVDGGLALALRPGKSQDENFDAWIGFVESIRRRGRCYPITRDKDGVIIDGRLRLIGCRLAGVEPQFETLSDDRDPGRIHLRGELPARQLHQERRPVRDRRR